MREPGRGPQTEAGHQLHVRAVDHGATQPDGHTGSLSHRPDGPDGHGCHTWPSPIIRTTRPARANPDWPSVNGLDLALRRNRPVIAPDERVDVKVISVVQGLAPAHDLVVSDGHRA